MPGHSQGLIFLVRVHGGGYTGRRCQLFEQRRWWLSSDAHTGTVLLRRAG